MMLAATILVIALLKLMRVDVAQARTRWHHARIAARRRRSALNLWRSSL